jgi:hypothetical protein
VTQDELAAAEEMVRSSERIRKLGGAQVSRVVCWAVDGGIACECEFENGALGSGIFDTDFREGAWFVREKPVAG